MKSQVLNNLNNFSGVRESPKDSFLQLGAIQRGQMQWVREVAGLFIGAKVRQRGDERTTGSAGGRRGGG